MISQTLATMNPTQLVEVLAQFKVRHPDFPNLIHSVVSGGSLSSATGIRDNTPRPS
jgi:hypothetical protein